MRTQPSRSSRSSKSLPKKADRPVRQAAAEATRTVSGTCVVVDGTGVLLTGPSGIGKSETALALISMGHRFVADDVVRVRVGKGGRIFGSGFVPARPVIEIRGLGVMDISRVYGPRAVAGEADMDLVVEFVPAEGWAASDPLVGIHPVGLAGRDVAGVRIPVSPGRSLPILVEAAVQLFRLYRRGIDPSGGFGRSLDRKLARGRRGS
ncbi:MAG: hypothetical protein HY039_05360 [Nitrospirae bacterium]|nr:hypothetical protein [Nitrospirota bacterium]